MTQTHLLSILIVLSGLGSLGTSMAHANPDESKSPYPDLSRYAKQNEDEYVREGHPGVWFSTGSGLNCAIGDEGSFGCSGRIPESPSGTNQIGWFKGDTSPHFDKTNESHFAREDGQKSRNLPATFYLEHDGVTCAVTPEDGVYCKGSGDAQFLVVGGRTYIDNSWKK